MVLLLIAVAFGMMERTEFGPAIRDNSRLQQIVAK